MSKPKFSKSNTSVRTRELIAELGEVGLEVDLDGDHISGYEVIAKKNGKKVAYVSCGKYREAAHAAMKTLLELVTESTALVEHAITWEENFDGLDQLKAENTALKAELAKAKKINEHAMGEIRRLLTAREAIGKEIEVMRDTIKGVITEMGHATAWANSAQKKLIDQINYANTPLLRAINGNGGNW